MKKTQKTTIQISLETKEALDSLKKYRRETYDDLIIRILDETEKAGKRPKEAGKGKKTDSDIFQEKNRKNSTDPSAELEY